MENNGNKRAIKTIIIEVVVILIVIIAVLFIFKIIPFSAPQLNSQVPTNQKTMTGYPIPVNAPGIRTVNLIYTLSGEVKSLTPNSDGTYNMVLNQYPSQTFTLDKNATVFDALFKNIIPLNILKPGMVVSISAVYNPGSKTWAKIPGLSNPQSVTPVPSAIPSK